MERLKRDALRHPLGFTGAALATAAGATMTGFLVADLLGVQPPALYLGIFVYVVLPVVLVIGLLLIPAGLVLERRRAQRSGAGKSAPHPRVLDFSEPRVRRIALAILALTTVNFVLLAAASNKGFKVLDSNEFCSSCHAVMQPEVSAHARSPHARVGCSECHIGQGANWAVKSKLSGAGQVAAVILHNYPRPIPTPVHDLRPARETCEQCHWPAKFIDDRLKVITHYADDAASTPRKTVMLLHFSNAASGRGKGMHWHVGPGVHVRYQADPKRQEVGTVELVREDGTRTTFSPSKPLQVSGGWREMDCVDCHNRPTHRFSSAEDEVDTAISSGTLDRSLPFIRRESVRALHVEYATAEAAKAGIAEDLAATYKRLDPEHYEARRAAVSAAAARLADMWAHNVWPAMKIGWGTYPSYLGHEAAPGCFRCHDGEHKSADGRVIQNDCSLCHSLLATEEADPAVLKQLEP